MEAADVTPDDMNIENMMNKRQVDADINMTELMLTKL